MDKRDIGAEILEGIKEIQQHKRGEVSLKTTELSEPSPPQVIRSKLNMSQSAFAG
jgi:putative transcriptional regulator